MSKTLSIITNFGCHFECPECIVRNSGIDVPRTTIGGLAQLDKAFRNNLCRVVSISGGGDPLFNYEDNFKWYRELFKWARSYRKNTLFIKCALNDEADTKIKQNLQDWYSAYGVPIEMHTGYTPNSSDFPFYDCYRVVYHVHSIEDLDSIYRTGAEIVRAVFVVSPKFTVRDIMDIAFYVEKSKDIDELSFREYVDDSFTPHPYLSDYLKLGHKSLWYYIEQDDYNLYYAENKVYSAFKDLPKA